MRTGRISLLASAAAAAIGLMATSASAATIIFDNTTDQPLAGAIYATFNGRTLGSTTQTDGAGITVSFTGQGGFVSGTAPYSYVAPTVSNGNGADFGGQANGTDTTTYVNAGVGTATLTFANPTSYFGALFGSIDPYNSLTFDTVDDPTGIGQTISGSTFFPSANDSTSAYVNFFSSSPITSIVAKSTQNSFEFDNVAFAPEPAAWAMMIIGFGVVGFALRRQKTVARVSYA